MTRFNLHYLKTDNRLRKSDRIVFGILVERIGTFAQ